MRFAALAVVLLAGCSTLGPTSTGVFSGRVVDEGGAPIAGASVVVLTDGARTVGAATNVEGLFAVERLPVGTYPVEVRYAGMYDEQFEVEVGQRSAFRTVVLRRDTTVTDVTVCGAAC